MQNIILNPISSEYLDNIFDAYPNNKIFYLEEGTYKLTKKLVISVAGIRLRGITRNAQLVHIVQTSATDNGIEINADNVSIEYITVHNENGEGMCVYQQDSSWNNINNCYFYGNAHNHTVYLGGPDVPNGSQQIDLFTNNIFSIYNVFDNNVIYTPIDAIALTFNLQLYGSVRDNIIRGGPINIFLAKSSMITNNYIYDSGKQGIMINLPTVNLTIDNNYIRHSTASSIGIKIPDELVDRIDLNQNLLINANTTEDCKYISVEINNGKNIEIKENKFKNTDDSAVYLLKSSNINIHDNLFSKNKNGVNLDINSINNTISNNEFFSIYPQTSQYAVQLIASADNNIVTNNIIKGTYLSNEINNNGANNTVATNTIVKYFSYSDEITKIIM